MRAIGAVWRAGLVSYGDSTRSMPAATIRLSGKAEISVTNLAFSSLTSQLAATALSAARPLRPAAALRLGRRHIGGARRLAALRLRFNRLAFVEGGKLVLYVSAWRHARAP